MSVRKRKWLTRSEEAREGWIVDYTDQQGERHIETFDKKKDADARHSEVKVGRASRRPCGAEQEHHRQASQAAIEFQRLDHIALMIPGALLASSVANIEEVSTRLVPRGSEAVRLPTAYVVTLFASVRTSFVGDVPFLSFASRPKIYPRWR